MISNVQGINQANILEGSANFWTRPGAVQFAGSEVCTLFQLDPDQGSIFIVKDADGKLKFFHVHLGHGRTDAECDVSSLDPGIKHMITATWSVSHREITLYVDRELMARARMNR